MSEEECFLSPSSSNGTDQHQKIQPRQRCFLSVHGMTCSSCVATIEKHLLKQSGIFTVQVALLACRAEVVYNPKVQTPEQIADLLDDMGFESSVIDIIESDRLNELNLQIDGLIDEDGATKVKEVLNNLTGVQTFTMEGAKIKIIHYPDVVGPRKIVDKINSLGFTAIAINTDIIKVTFVIICIKCIIVINIVFFIQNASDPLRDEIARWRNTFFFILFFAIPTFLTMIYFMIILPNQRKSSGSHHQSFLLTNGLSLENLLFFLLATPVQTYGARDFYSKVILIC